MEGYVYLLLEVDVEGNERHKIGITRREISTRIKELQTGNSNKISILNSYKSENYHKIENFLHKKYQHLKTETNNEWFKLPDNFVISFIKDCKTIDSNINFLKLENPFMD